MMFRSPPARLEASDPGPSWATSTTTVRTDGATGESVIDFGDAEVLGPPLRLEAEPEVLGTQIGRAPEVAGPDFLARTGDDLGALGTLGALLVVVGAVLCWRAQPGIEPDVEELDRGLSPLTIRWLDTPPSSSAGLTLRFL